MSETPANTQVNTRKLTPEMEAAKWQPGQSGNPSGRPKKKPLTELYEKLAEDPEFMAQVEQSIRKMVTSGRMVGQLQLKEMTERIEGKVSQPVEGEFTLVTISERMRKARERAAGG